MIDYKQLLVLRLSHLTEWLNENEMIVPEEMHGDFNYGETCEFLGDGKYILRDYYESGQLCWKAEYQNGQRHGLDLGWWESGQQWWKEEWQNNQQHGLSIEWLEDGKKRLKEEWENGKLIKRTTL